MATINGYTAEKMKEIADAAIDSVEVVDDDLLIHHADGSTTNAGNVRGFPSDIDMAIYDPIGVPKPFTLSTLPPGNGWCDAATEFDGATYPILAAEYGTGVGCINGASSAGKFRLPNLKGRVLVGRDPAIPAFDTLHETGGSKDAVVVSHTHTADQAAHTHTADGQNHNHGIPASGDHVHPVDGDTGDRIAFTNPSTHATVTVGGGDATAQEIAYTSMDAAGQHDHSGWTGDSDPAITIGNTDTAITVSTDGVSGTDKNLQPYRVVNYIMRLG